MARVAGAPLLARLPIDPELAQLCDRGEIESYISEIVDKLGKSLSEIPLSCVTPTVDCQSCDHNCKH
jgi:hypothetical protein